MPWRMIFGCFLFAVCVSTTLAADDAKWVTIKGRVFWEGSVPEQKINLMGVDPAKCKKDGNAKLEEDFIINAKNKGLKDVFIWIRPDGAKGNAAFPPNLIHPTLAKSATDSVQIDQPCCRFIPHALAAREGQKMTIKNSADFAHNANWNSIANGAFNVLIPAGAQNELPAPLKFESGEIQLKCNIHGWMAASVRVFDHPYYAVTDEDGKFEIKLAPTGKFNLYASHPKNGWLDGTAGRGGKPLNITKDMDVGELKMIENK